MTSSKYIGKFKNGDTFGSWVVLDEKVVFDNKSRAFILLKCKNCENKGYRECRPLLNNTSTRCNVCNYSFNGRGNNKNPNFINGETSSPITMAYNRSLKENISWNLSTDYLEHLYKIQSSSCHISGDSIVLSNNIGHLIENSMTHNAFSAILERIDNTKSYEPGNVAWISSRIKSYKKNKPQSEFIQMCLDVAKKHTGEKNEENS